MTELVLPPDIEELEVSFDDVVEPAWDKELEAYLRRFPPAKSQFRSGRRDPDLRSVIVLHTAESGTDMSGADSKAEGVARFVRGRSTFGSYHLVGDADSVIQLVRFADEAFHVGTHRANRWTIGISLAINAADWPDMTPGRRGQFVHVAASMAAYAGAHMYLRGIQVPAARFLTAAEATAGKSGITSHGRLDPTRRSDPGPMFPWRAFLRRYQDLVEPLTGYLLEWGADDRPVNTWELYVEEAQQLLGVTPDGKFGPKTLARLQALADANDDMQNAITDVGRAVAPWLV